MPDGTLLAGCDDASRLIPPEAALGRLLAQTRQLGVTEACAAQASAGRVLAADVTAPRCLPPFHHAAMDGFALTAADLAIAHPPRVLRRITAGDPPGAALLPGEAARVLTGAALPAGAAAVVMEEHARVVDGRLWLRRKPEPGQNIRRAGEDVAEGAAVLAAGRRVVARDVALLAALGIATVQVRARPRVGVLSNGNELAGGLVHDSNRPMLLALLRGADVELVDLGLLPDDPRHIAAALRAAAAGTDLILTTGGLSGSDADHLPAALLAAGGTVEVLRLAQKPGKPLAHGQLGAARCLLLPGNPVAALVGMLTLGLPLLARLAGAEACALPPQPVRLARDLHRTPGRVEFRPARRVGLDASGLPLVEPLGRGGSASLSPLVEADGLVRLPAEAARFEAGERLGFLPFPEGC
ncbi:gephyrin-like molybdotransferase Glp [Falsiroseomonas sp.]|uniref:molybdopterin molybdotransferase MoeA n=1 Tax=Falsiroseomonas sp. TaxID=2870721 RepID=UPI003568EB99